MNNRRAGAAGGRILINKGAPPPGGPCEANSTYNGEVQFCNEASSQVIACGFRVIHFGHDFNSAGPVNQGLLWAGIN